MKTKNIIIITNLFDADKAIVVKNFSDENVKVAISELMAINPIHLKRTSSSMSEGIFQVTQDYRHLRDEVKTIFNSEEVKKLMPVYLKLSYATLYE